MEQNARTKRKMQGRQKNDSLDRCEQVERSKRSIGFKNAQRNHHHLCNDLAIVEFAVMECFKYRSFHESYEKLVEVKIPTTPKKSIKTNTWSVSEVIILITGYNNQLRN